MIDTGLREVLLRELVDRMQARANGVLFVATGNNQAISLALTDGRMTYCTGGRAHGQASLLCLSGASVAKFSFTDHGNHPFRSLDEIVHEEAMAVLRLPVAEAASLPSLPKSEDAPRSETAVGQRMYRGRPVSEPRRDTSPASPRSDMATVTKSVRYYRGQPLLNGA